MFLTDLVFRATEPGRARLESHLIWNDDRFGYVRIPEGVATDLGSTPQLLHRFRTFDPWHTGRRSAVIHDYLYAYGKWPDGRPVTRATADEFLRYGIVAEGYGASVARSWWLGVRVGGWLPWGRYRARELRGSPPL
jgi:hypothetical protein